MVHSRGFAVDANLDLHRVLAVSVAGAHSVYSASWAHSRSARRASTWLISRRYSAEARWSVIGWTSRATDSAARSISVGGECFTDEQRLRLIRAHGRWEPRRRARCVPTRTCHRVAMPRPAATFTTAISVSVRPNFWNDHPARPFVLGNEDLHQQSAVDAALLRQGEKFAQRHAAAAASWFARRPMRPWRAAVSRYPAAGEPLARFPPMVARLRIWMEPQVAAARARMPPASPTHDRRMFQRRHGAGGPDVASVAIAADVIEAEMLDVNQEPDGAVAQQRKIGAAGDHAARAAVQQAHRLADARRLVEGLDVVEHCVLQSPREGEHR